MPFEVEQKYRAADHAAIAAAVEKLGGRPLAAVQQADTYFAHPARDFAQTDEALRLRRVGERNVVTYKGPKVDQTTKTRREIELPLAEGCPSYESWVEMLTALGFRTVRQVTKTRTPYRLDYGDRAFEVALDEVDGLGAFVELETTANEDQLESARQALHDLATDLKLTDSETRSYLELLIEADSPPTGDA